MSEDKKPKKDLRARLGKTIVPNTPGTPPIAVPNVGAGPAAPAPVVAPAAPASVPPPPAGPVPVVPPPIAAAPVPSPFGGPAVAPPPFVQPAPHRSEPPKPKAPVDPFAAAPAQAAPREVRLVIDDKPVDDAEVGRRQRGRNFLLLGIGLVVGALLGGGFGSMNARNVLYNVTVRDGRAIYEAVDAASRVVLDAQQKVDRLVERAAGTAGQPPAVDYETIEQLRAIEAPMHAGAFARKNYGAFQPATVDDLFAYYNNVQVLWERFQRLAATTLPEARRTELDRTARLAADAATTTYGVIPQATEQGVVGVLVVLDPPREGSTKLMARARPGDLRGRELERLTVDTTIGENPTHVFPIDNAASAGVLSAQLGAFRQYVNDIREIKTLMDQTVEIQGRLTTALGEIARLEEVFAF